MWSVSCTEDVKDGQPFPFEIIGVSVLTLRTYFTGVLLFSEHFYIIEDIAMDSRCIAVMYRTPLGPYRLFSVVSHGHINVGRYYVAFLMDCCISVVVSCCSYILWLP